MEKSWLKFYNQMSYTAIDTCMKTFSGKNWDFRQHFEEFIKTGLSFALGKPCNNQIKFEWEDIIKFTGMLH